MNANAQSESPGGMEIISTREIAAPREILFGVFADPAELALWWGPKGFTNTITQFDFRSGGAWRFTMTMTFEPLGNPGGTRLTWRMLFDPNEGNEKIKGFIIEANEPNFDRLETHIAARQAK